MLSNDNTAICEVGAVVTKYIYNPGKSARDVLTLRLISIVSESSEAVRDGLAELMTRT